LIQIQDAVSEIFMPEGLGIEFIASHHLGLVGNKVGPFFIKDNTFVSAFLRRILFAA